MNIRSFKVSQPEVNQKEMRAIILAAGYGTRLERELIEDGDAYKHLINIPKALLPIGSVPLITRMVEKLHCVKCIKDVIVVTNSLHFRKFVEWKSSYGDNVQLVCDNSTCNDNRLGSTGAIQFVLEQMKIDDDVLVIAGDTLFYENFDIENFINEFYHRIKEVNDCVLVTSYTCTENAVMKHGILELNEKQKVTKILEKPKPSETKSRQACPCFYTISGSILHLVSNFLNENKDMPLQAKDATGHLLKYFVNKSNVYAYPISGRFDVGGLQSYIECNKHFSN